MYIFSFLMQNKKRPNKRECSQIAIVVTYKYCENVFLTRFPKQKTLWYRIGNIVSYL